MAFKHYFYQEQTRNYMTQFVHLFSGLRVKTGKRDTGQSVFVTVPVRYASQDRMANMLAQTHGNTDPDLIDRIATSVPIMSAYMVGIDIKPESRRNNGIVDRRTYVTVEDVAESANDTEASSQIRVKARPMPTPYTLTMELNIYASNTDQHLQMLEQILMIFNPEVTIQANDSLWDWTALTNVKLTDISLTSEIPIGVEEQVIGSTLTFELPIWISAPMIEIKGTGHVGAVRAVPRDASAYDGDLDNLVIGDNIGTIPSGTTSTGIDIELLGEPIDTTVDEAGVDSGVVLPPKNDVNT